MKSTSGDSSKLKIGIFGSSANTSSAMIKKAKQLGQELAKYNLLILTGAGEGLPLLVADKAAKSGKEVWGYPPAVSVDSFKRLSQSQNLKIYKKLIYVPTNYEFAPDTEVLRKYRNVSTTATCDAGIIISGRWGTLNEFTNLHDMGKVIGVLTGTGGIADELPRLYKKITKKSKAKVIFESEPKVLVRKIVGEFKK